MRCDICTGTTKHSKRLYTSAKSKIYLRCYCETLWLWVQCDDYYYCDYICLFMVQFVIKPISYELQLCNSHTLISFSWRFPLKITSAGRTDPSAATARTTVTWRFSLFDVLTMTLLLPLGATVLLGTRSKKTGVSSMLIMNRLSNSLYSLSSRTLRMMLHFASRSAGSL